MSAELTVVASFFERQVSKERWRNHLVALIKQRRAKYEALAKACQELSPHVYDFATKDSRMDFAVFAKLANEVKFSHEQIAFWCLLRATEDAWAALAEAEQDYLAATSSDSSRSNA